MLKAISHITPTQITYIALAIYANYQVLKWVFKVFSSIATSSLIRTLTIKLTPKFVVENRIKAEKLRRINEKVEKEKQHQEALEIHRKYQYTGWWNIGFIEEDRATLFKGYEDISWRWGSQRIDRAKNYTPDDSRHLAFMIFQEIAVYRWTFIENQKWTPEMEIFWNKILPPQFRGKNKTAEDYFEDQLKTAIEDFDEDRPTKASA